MDNLDKLRQLAEYNGYCEDYIVSIINYAKQLINNKVPVIFDSTHLSLLTSTSTEFLEELSFGRQSKYYFKFELLKRNGKTRRIDAPEPLLKNLQRMILSNILQNVNVSEYCHGFTRGRSIITNASQHVGQKLVYNLDLKDFFPSIKQARVKNVFRDLGYSEEVSYLLGSICCLNGCLPQGAPTSPAISNIVCWRLDKRLGRLALTNSLVYTRYADDLTFSGAYHLKKLAPLIKSIIAQEGFEVNPQKENLFHSNKRQIVTGLTVNTKVGIPRSFINNLRQEIYYAKKFGPKLHSQNLKDSEQVEYLKLNLKGYLFGKVLFINSVNPALADKFFEQLKYIYWD